MNLRCGTRTGQTQRDCCAQFVGQQRAGAPFGHQVISAGSGVSELGRALLQIRPHRLDLIG